MAFVDIQPAYRDLLGRHGLADADRLQALPGVIVSGHPGRHVCRVTLGAGPAAVRAFLKREHRVPWKDRLASLWQGAGLASKSYREYQLLAALRAAGIGCPEPIAAGEDRQGRAFLLVRDLAGACDLRTFLLERAPGRPHERRRLLRRLGEALARVHDAGFDHPDLYAKHVLVEEATGTVAFLDWQRTRRRRDPGWPRRWRDLAALDATLADDLASDRERLACLRAYLRAAVQVPVPRSFLVRSAREIRRRSVHLRRRRRIREQRQAPLPAGAQNLLWLEGEALCVTRDFHRELGGRVPEWLAGAAGADDRGKPVQEAVIPLSGERQARLVRRISNRPWRWLLAALWRRPLGSPELAQAAALFRLQRFGVGTPRLLAFGQRHRRPWRTESFLLTEHPPGAVGLADWLQRQSGHDGWGAERKQRRLLLREAGAQLRRMHDAGYYAGRRPDELFLVQPGGGSPPRPAVLLGGLEGLLSRRRARSAWVREDLAALHRALAPVLGSRTDQFRFLRGYLGGRGLTPAARRLVREAVAGTAPGLALRLWPRRLAS